jgi:hypothetical protein
MRLYILFNLSRLFKYVWVAFKNRIKKIIQFIILLFKFPRASEKPLNANFSTSHFNHEKKFCFACFASFSFLLEINHILYMNKQDEKKKQ